MSAIARFENTVETALTLLEKEGLHLNKEKISEYYVDDFECDNAFIFLRELFVAYDELVMYGKLSDYSYNNLKNFIENK